MTLRVLLPQSTMCLPPPTMRLALPPPMRLVLPPMPVRGLLEPTTRVTRGLASNFPVRLSMAKNRLRMRMRNILSAIDKRPLLFAVSCGLAKNLLCDTFAQKGLQGKEHMDFRRLGAFAFFGIFYIGCTQYMFYNKIFPIVTSKIKLKSKLARACFGSAYDNLFVLPFFFLPTFYTVKQVFAGKGGFKEAHETYRANFRDDLTASWCIYGPAQFINFGFLPVNLRVPFTTLVGFFYITGLSYFRGEMH